MIVLSWNAHSLDLTKREILFDTMEQHQIAVSGVSETWNLHGLSQSYDCTFSGMNSFGYQHPTGRRGIGCFSQPTVKIKYLQPYCIQDQNYSMITTIINTIVIIFIYVPNGSYAAHMDELIDKLELIQHLYPNVCVLGDFNARLSILPNEPTNPGGQRLRQFIHSSRFTRLPIDTPTFPSTPSCIDHALTTCPHLISDYGALSSTFASDHLPIWIQINTDVTLDAQRPVTSWRRVARIVDRDLPSWNDDEDPEQQLANFVNLVCTTRQKCTQLRKEHSNIRAYIDRDLRKLITKRNHACGTKRAQLTLQVRNEVRKRKRRAYREFCQQGTSSTSSARQWRTLKLVRDANKRSTPPPEPDECQQIAAMFHDFHIIRPDLQPPSTFDDIFDITSKFSKHGECIPFEGVTDIEIKKLLKSLRSKSSVGSDDISMHLLKDAGPRLLCWIADCFNYSMRNGFVSTLWKTANIIALPKSSGGYRPISLLPNLGKLLERVILKRLRRFCKDNDVIPNNQYANKGGTAAALSELLNYVSHNHPKPTYVVFFDVRKAFDRVHPPTLLKYLIELGTPAYLVVWITNYLWSRSAQVGQCSYKLLNGVPQGSVLGPVLFQIYIAPVLQDLKNVYTAYYADDLCIASGGKADYVIGAHMQRALNSISVKCNKLGIELDPRKTKAMWMKRCTNRQSFKHIRLKLGSKVLEYATCYKYLGVLLENRLTFTKYIQSRIDGAAKRNGVVFKLSGVVKSKLRTFWRGYVEPYLLYGVPQIYHLLSETNKNKLRSFYARCARNIAGLIPHCPADLSITVAGLQPLEDLLTNRLLKKKKRKKFRKTCIDLPQSDQARRCEVNFNRWRSGYLYTNQWKSTHHFNNCDGLCRFCKTHKESRLHIIFE